MPWWFVRSFVFVPRESGSGPVDCWTLPFYSSRLVWGARCGGSWKVLNQPYPDLRGGGADNHPLLTTCLLREKDYLCAHPLSRPEDWLKLQGRLAEGGLSSPYLDVLRAAICRVLFQPLALWKGRRSCYEYVSESCACKGKCRGFHLSG